MIKRKFTIATAAALFFVLAGTGVASALWSTPAAVTSKVQVATLADDCDPTSVRSMLNASFETPVIAGGIGYASGEAVARNGYAAMEGWRSRTNNGTPSRIEIWTNGTQYDNLPAVVAPVGRQFVELNADEPGTLYQQLTTVPGQTMQWSFLHRGRMGADTMELLIGAPGGTVAQNTFTDSYQSVAGNNGWVRYSGVYVVPAGQTTTELGFRSLTPGSLGNFLDDVSFGTGPCVTAASSVSNTTPTTGETIEYSTVVKNSGTMPAVSSLFNWTIPAGLSYVANSLTVSSGAGSVSGSAVSVRLGVGTTATAGGSIAQATETKVTFRVVVTAAASTVLDYLPGISYSNGLAAGWTRTAYPATLQVTVASGADVRVAARVSSATIARSKPLSWTFDVTNGGPAASSGVVLRVTLPTAMNAFTVSGGGATCTTVTGVTGARDCTFPTAFAVGETRTVTVAGTTSSNAASGTNYTVSGVARATTLDPSTANNSASATTVVDITAPPAPTNVGADTTRTTVTLGWSAPQSNAADVAFYDIYRDDELVGTVTAPTTGFTDTGLSARTYYEYQIFTRDAAGNSSNSAGGWVQTTR